MQDCGRDHRFEKDFYEWNDRLSQNHANSCFMGGFVHETGCNKRAARAKSFDCEALSESFQ